MTNPCEIGFMCPYKKFNEDGDRICAFFCRVTPDITRMIEEVECPLVKSESPLKDYLVVYTMENRMVKTYCARCGKSGHVYPVKYKEPMKNQCYAVDLCFKCAHEHHKVMVDWCNTWEESE